MTSTRTEILLDVAGEFSPYPSGRFPTDGHFNGERFRQELLGPRLKEAIKIGGVLKVDIDGVRTFGSSFLEEAFAGLIRLGIVDRQAVLKHLSIVCTKPYLQFYREEIARLLVAAAPQAQAS